MGKVRHGEGSRRLGVSPEYKSWRSMRSRCKYPSLPGFKDYGGRGIKVCDRWEHSFESFLTDMGRKPSLDCEIDRIDINGNYEPNNCRWLPRSENRKNKRNAFPIAAHGCTLSLAEWTRLSGIHKETIKDRLRAGWPPDLAVSIRPGVGRPPAYDRFRQGVQHGAA